MLRHRDRDEVRMPMSAQRTAGRPTPRPSGASSTPACSASSSGGSAPQIAEDILQEVMLRIHRQADGIERAEAVGAWVHAITRTQLPRRLPLNPE